MKNKINRTRSTSEIASYNNIALTFEVGGIFGKNGAGYIVRASEDLTCFDADTSQGWASMRSAYEKAALFFNDLVPFDASIPAF